jgi:hypothetical protein
MIGSPGDRIVVESEKVGTPAREGIILEVIEGKSTMRYRVRWDDGHETTFLPYSGSAHVIKATPTEPEPAGTKG